MNTIKLSIEIPEDGHVEFTLPPGTPTGQAEIVVTIPSPQAGAPSARTSLADWAEQNAEHWGTGLAATNVEGFTGRRF